MKFEYPIPRNVGHFFAALTLALLFLGTLVFLASSDWVACIFWGVMQLLNSADSWVEDHNHSALRDHAGIDEDGKPKKNGGTGQ